MIKNLGHGWCEFILGDFVGTPSYITDVPVDLLQAFIDYRTKGCGMCWFDEEGTEFTLVITPYSLFIIDEDDEPVLHEFSDLMGRGNLERELVADIENDLYGWAEFTCDDDPEEIKIHRNEIRQKLTELKKVMLK